MPSAHCSSNTKLSRNVSGTSLYFYLDQQGGGVTKTFKKLKVLEFFVDCSLIDAKLFFVTPTLWYLMHSERCTHIVRHCILSTSLDFYFDQQIGEIPRILRNIKLYIFFFVCLLQYS